MVPGGSAISMLILLDRAVDPATPMCTQLTYEGIVDEMLRINNGVVQIEGQGGDHERAHCSASLPCVTASNV